MRTKEYLELRREILDEIIDNAAKLSIESQYLVLNMAKAMKQVHSPETKRGSAQYSRKKPEHNT